MFKKCFSHYPICMQFLAVSSNYIAVAVDVAAKCTYEPHVFSHSVAMSSAECNRCIYINISSNTSDTNLADQLHLWTTIAIFVIRKVRQKIDVFLTTSAQASNTTVCRAAQVKTKRVSSKWTVTTKQIWLLTKTQSDVTKLICCNYSSSSTLNFEKYIIQTHTFKIDCVHLDHHLLLNALLISNAVVKARKIMLHRLQDFTVLQSQKTNILKMSSHQLILEDMLLLKFSFLLQIGDVDLMLSLAHLSSSELT